MVLIVLFVGGCSEEGGPKSESIPCTIHHLTSLYRGYPVVLSENLSFEAVVSANDRYGEMRSRVALQDHTGGIMVLVDHPALYKFHSPGDVVRVDCRGLVLGGYGNSVRLGGEGYDDEEVGRLSLAEWNGHHEKVGVAERLEYSSKRIGELQARDIATLAVVERVRVVEAGESWGSAEGTLTRHLVDVERESDTLCVRLSSRADFLQEIIPQGECRIRGVVDYFHDEFRLVLSSPDDVLPIEVF